MACRQGRERAFLQVATATCIRTVLLLDALYRTAGGGGREAKVGAGLGRSKEAIDFERHFALVYGMSVHMHVACMCGRKNERNGVGERESERFWVCVHTHMREREILGVCAHAHESEKEREGECVCVLVCV